MLDWEEQLGDEIKSLLRPGMTAALVGADPSRLAPLMKESLGPSGRVVAVAPAPDLPLGEVLPDGVDLLLMDTEGGEHLALRRARALIESSRPVLLVAFSPQKLREAETDPVAVLDEYRAMGLRASGAKDDLPADPGELVLALDARETPFTTLRLDPVDGRPPPHERLLPTGLRLGRTLARRFPPVEPRTLAYDAAHRGLTSALLSSEEWMERFAAGAQLPPGLGSGFDERVVEYPWLLSRGLKGRVLDAGSVLNHRQVLEPLLPKIDGLTIVTLAPEPSAFTELGVSYLYADLRSLPLRDGWFDEVVCLSTLEHVGMDNAIYGAAGPRAEDPRAEAAAALRELLRVVRPGGRVHISVPFGRREDHGWLRQLDREDVDDLLARCGAADAEYTVFQRTRRGWRRSSAQRASRVTYHDSAQRADDGAVAARAVICATLRRPAD